MRSTRYTTCAIALAAALSMPAFAQGTGSTTSPSATGATSTTTDSSNFARRDNDGGFEWSWLGLLGLVGLMGLRKQHPDVNRVDNTRASVTR